MALSTKLEMRQSQSLVMTPQLMQAIKLLQFSNLDLAAYVEAELERNPLLERGDPEAGTSGEGAGDSPLESLPEASSSSGEAYDGGPDGGFDGGAGGDSEAGDWMKNQLETSAETIASSMDTDLGNVFPDESGVAPAPEQAIAYAADQGRTGGGVSEDYNLEAFVAEEQSLTLMLTDQMNLALADPVDKLIGLHLINSLDENGYLAQDLAEAAEQLGVSLGRVEAVLAVLQGFEPSGVFARSLVECLTLQLKERDRFDPAMATLIENIDLLARRELAALRRLCGVDEEDLTDMIAEIRALDPRPGRAFGSALVQSVVPDVIVRRASDGGWNVELNAETLPRVLVNQTYYASVTRTARKDAERSYLTDCLQTANWLVKSLDQRARTILKVSTEIVRQQDGFLAHGIEHLRPLNLKTIADAVGMHESTISRVTSNKYMATSRGIFELKYFFSSAISATEGGDAHSAEAVRHRIKQLIDAESPTDILSDDTLVKMLKDEGIDIARRTVAKYREALRISSSVQRRREKSGAR